MRIITIEIPEAGDVIQIPNIREGDKHANGLGKDELLGTIASLLFAEKYIYPMGTDAEWKARLDRWTTRNQPAPAVEPPAVSPTQQENAV